MSDFDCAQLDDPEINEDDFVDGRDIHVVSEYASTCDGCGELTCNQELLMDEETQLGFCFECVRGGNLPFGIDPEKLID